MSPVCKQAERRPKFIRPSIMRCPITGEEMEKIFSHEILGKYDVDYFYSRKSGIIKTQPPHWLDEAYQNAITDADIGLVGRNLLNRDKVIRVLALLGIEGGRYLDLAGGYGLFTRLMRDAGYDFHTTDRYCENIFARHHEPADGFKADALTAFEVLEHIEDPIEFIEGAFEKYGCRTLVCSTQDYGRQIPELDWWYWLFDSGQHITFYNEQTFKSISERLKCNYHRIDSGFHVFTDRPLSALKGFIIKHRKLRNIYANAWLRMHRRRGLLDADFKALPRTHAGKNDGGRP